MRIETISYTVHNGWSCNHFPKLDSPSTLLLVFGESDLLDKPEPIDELIKNYPNSVVMGCSTAGAVIGERVVDETISVAIVRFERTHLRLIAAPVVAMDQSYQTGKMLGQRLLDHDLSAVFLLSDGLMINGSHLISGLNSVLAPRVIVTGGLAGDGDRFKRTWVLHNGKPCSGMVTAVGFYGSAIRIGHGSRGGWDIFGVERKVTRSSDNVLFELDGKPALILYKSYLGQFADNLPASGLLFPLALRDDENDGHPIVRTLLAVNEEDQSMTFAGNIPEGSLVRLMKANFDRLVEGAAEAALLSRATAATEENGVCLSIAISCVGRRLVLGERTEEELERTLEVLPMGTLQVGFYSYGELSPYANGRCDLHNQTMTLTTLSED